MIEKLGYMDRLVIDMEKGADKAEFSALPYAERIVPVRDCAKLLIAEHMPGEYDLGTVIAEPHSYKDGDWYLYEIAAKRLQPRIHEEEWSVWSLNISSRPMLFHGKYDIPRERLESAIADKRG